MIKILKRLFVEFAEQSYVGSVALRRWTDKPFEGSTEYVRSDLYEEAIEALKEAERYIFDQAEARNFEPPVPDTLVVKMSSVISTR